MMTTEFSATRFIRTGGGISFEERAATADDLDWERARAAAADGSGIIDDYPGADVYEGGVHWSTNVNTTVLLFRIDGMLVKIPKMTYFDHALDAYISRRTVITITGRQRVETKTLQASQLAGFKPPGIVTPRNFVLPGGEPSAIPEGKYLLQDFSFRDLGNGYTDVEVSYRAVETWELVRP